MTTASWQRGFLQQRVAQNATPSMDYTPGRPAAKAGKEASAKKLSQLEAQGVID